jgi:hypothetical protein
MIFNNVLAQIEAIDGGAVLVRRSGLGDHDHPTPCRLYRRSKASIGATYKGLSTGESRPSGNSYLSGLLVKVHSIDLIATITIDIYNTMFITAHQENFPSDTYYKRNGQRSEA